MYALGSHTFVCYLPALRKVNRPSETSPAVFAYLHAQIFSPREFFTLNLRAMRSVYCALLSPKSSIFSLPLAENLSARLTEMEQLLVKENSLQGAGNRFEERSLASVSSPIDMGLNNGILIENPQVAYVYQSNGKALNQTGD